MLIHPMIPSHYESTSEATPTNFLFKVAKKQKKTKKILRAVLLRRSVTISSFCDVV